MNYQIIEKSAELDSQTREQLAEFLYDHLDEYGDKKSDILKSIDFAMGEKGELKSRSPLGGLLVIARKGDKIVGAVVINKTGMDGYIPENILVYIATHREYRGKGIGKELMKQTIGAVRGGIKLHVEPDNPARFLYEKMGFTSKYLEMRYLPG
jgi:ribosomal protein S18 acetylase RimI-like enzyme